MSIQIDLIAQYLTELDFEFDQVEGDIIRSGFSDEQGEHVATVFKLGEDGEYLDITCWSEQNLEIESCDDLVRAEIYKWMLHQNYRAKIGNWEYNPLKHDSHFSIEVAIEDGDLTFAQFKRFIGVIFSVSRDMAVLKELVEGMSFEQALELENRASKDAMKEKLQAMLQVLEEEDASGTGSLSGI